jgi:hypothetical protein
MRGEELASPFVVASAVAVAVVVVVALVAASFAVDPQMYRQGFPR